MVWPALFCVIIDRRLLLLVERECTFIELNMIPASSSQSPISKSLSSTSSNLGCLMSKDYHSIVSNYLASSANFCRSKLCADVYRKVGI